MPSIIGRESFGDLCLGLGWFSGRSKSPHPRNPIHRDPDVVIVSPYIYPKGPSTHYFRTLGRLWLPKSKNKDYLEPSGSINPIKPKA